MAENILFTLVDEYGNSLEKFKLGGRYTFFYNYFGEKPEEVLTGSMHTGIAYGNLEKPKPDLESTTLVIELDSEFYNAPGKLLYKGEYQSPQNIMVSKKALDPEKKYDLLKRSVENLRTTALQRVQQA